MRLAHVIHLTGTRWTLHSWRRDRFAAVLGGEPAGAGLRPLLDRLQAGPAGPIGILADLAEEEYVRETVPRLSRRDQAAVLSRRLARAFPRTSYRTAVLQGREDNDPPAQRVLYCALNNPELPGTLLAELARARLPLAVVASPALLSAPILRKLRPGLGPGAATLLVSRQQEGGLRFAYFRGAELAGSRLLRSAVAARPGDLERLLRQMEESLRYFDPAFAPGAAHPVDVLLLAEPALADGWEDALPAGAEHWRLQAPDPAALAAALGLRAALARGEADRLFVELLRRHAPAGNFASNDERRYSRLLELRQLGQAACVALTGTGLLAAGLNLASITEQRDALAGTRTAIAGVSAALTAQEDTEFGTGADPLEMQRAVTAWEALRRHRIDPREVLATLSQAVSARPRIQVDSIQWSPLVAVGTTATGDEADGTAEAADEAAPGDGADSQATEDVNQRVRINIAGRIEPFERDYRLAFAELEAFMDQLRRNPRVTRVTVRRQPLDVDPRSTLSGEMSTQRREEEAAFSVDVVMRLNDDPA